MSRLRPIFAVIVMGASMSFGGVVAHAASPVSARTGQIVDRAQTDLSPTTQPVTAGEDDAVTVAADPTSRRSANGTTRRVTIALLAIAATTAVMASIYFWYTIPARRLRIHERDK